MSKAIVPFLPAVSLVMLFTGPALPNPNTAGGSQASNGAQVRSSGTSGTSGNSAVGNGTATGGIQSGQTKPGNPVSSPPQTRTFVSGLGNDNNPCTASQPCRTLNAALLLTAAGGEIYVLDSADYGPVTINKALTIASDGAVAGVLATSGVGIAISAGSNDVVTLRGLNIDGGTTGNVGIQFNAGKALNVQKSVLRGFVNAGLYFAPSGASTIFVSDTTATKNAGNGIIVTGSTGGTLNRVTATSNGAGILASGIATKITISDTVSSNNNYGLAATGAEVMVRNSTFSNNSVGISADQSGMVRVGLSTITANATGWQASNGAQVQSYGNNGVSGNSADGSATATVALR